VQALPAVAPWQAPALHPWAQVRAVWLQPSALQVSSMFPLQVVAFGVQTVEPPEHWTAF
jgi:hypothetical protein